MWTAAAVVALLIVGGGVTAAVVLSGSEPAQPTEVVVLEPASSAGDDPFLTAAAITEVTVFPDSVQAVAATAAASMTSDPATGTLTSPGTTDNLYGGRQEKNAQLYGGSGRLDACDIDELGEFLAANPDKARAWADVRDIAPGSIAEYLKTLTPVVLLHDTAVTNHGFSNGAAVPRQAVLQAGTGVLIDQTGQPVVRCACGNPLTAPTITSLATADVQGTAWSGYDPARTVAVTAGPTKAGFVLVDVGTGESYTRAVGPAAPDRFHGLAGITGTFSDGTVNGSSAIVTSPDGLTWAEVFTGPKSLRGLAVGNGLAIAVGDTIVTSSDGITWAEVPNAPTGLSDVAYGNNMWLAIGQADPAARVDDMLTFETYTSSDGVSWQQRTQNIALDGGERWDLGLVAYGGGRWVVSAATDLGGDVMLFVASTDGVTWSLVSDDFAPVPGSAAWNGQVWGLVGGQIEYPSDQFTVTLLAATSSDLLSWPTANGSPKEANLRQLSCSGDRGWLAVGSDAPLADANRLDDLWRSADLMTWTKLGRPATGRLLDAVSFGDAAAPSATSCGASISAATGPTAQPGGTGAAPPAVTPAPAPPSGAQPADLALTVPPTRPACDGTGIVIYFSAVTPGAYGTQIQDALNANPGSSYLRTDQSCASLNQSYNGNPIYAVYRPIGPDRAGVCAAVNATGPPAYGKWLDNTTPPDEVIDCE